MNDAVTSNKNPLLRDFLHTLVYYIGTQALVKVMLKTLAHDVKANLKLQDPPVTASSVFVSFTLSLSLAA